MAAPKIGFQFDTQGVDALVPSSAEMSVIGAVVTAPAKADGVEYNTPYAINSDDADFFASLGATGTGQQTMTGAGRQLGEMQKSTRMVVVVVPEGANDRETMYNMVGSPALKTGVHTLKSAAQKVARTPRLNIAPGYTSQYVEATGVSVLSIDAGGTGYLVGDNLTATGGSGAGFAGEVTKVDENGAITGVAITNSGIGYTSNPTLAVTTTAGSGATVSCSVGASANPVCVELATVNDTLLAVSPVTGPSSTRQAAIDWREGMASKRLIPTDTDVKIAGVGSDIVVPSDAYVAGMINRVDELHGGYPFHSAGNRAMYGVTGPARDIAFSLTEGDTEGQELLSSDIGIIVRGEANDDYALAEGGILYLGVSTASNESLWQYYNQVRGRDWIHLTLMRTLRELLAKNNLNNRTIQAVVNTMRRILSDLAADERIHREFQIKILPAENSTGELRLGQITIRMYVEEPAPFLRTTIKSNRYEFALTSFVENLASQINQIAL